MDGCQKGIAKLKDCCNPSTSVSMLKHIKNKPLPKVFISGVEVCSGFAVVSVLNAAGSVLCKGNLFTVSLKRVCMLGGAEKEKIADPAVPFECWELYDMWTLLWHARTYPWDYKARFRSQCYQLVAV